MLIFIYIQLLINYDLQFERKEPTDDGYITEVAFTELLLAYAGFSEKKKSRIIKRVKKQ